MQRSVQTSGLVKALYTEINSQIPCVKYQHFSVFCQSSIVSYFQKLANNSLQKYAVQKDRGYAH